LFSWFHFLCLLFSAFLDFSPRTHFWPFTEVLQEIRRGITRKVWIFGDTTDSADITDGDKRRKQKETKAVKALRNQAGSEPIFVSFVIFC